MQSRILFLTLILAAVFALGLNAALAQETGDDAETNEVHGTGETAVAILQDAEGNEVGQVIFRGQEMGAIVVVGVNGLPAGFHGFHIHTTGDCGDSGNGAFTAAGGHWNMTEEAHPNHTGDLPVLMIGQDGAGYLAAFTDRFLVSDLFDEDGSAVIVHGNPDNYANIPERYNAPDDETRNAGDSGQRLACGVVMTIENTVEATQTGATEAAPAEATETGATEAPAEATAEATEAS